MDGQKDLVTVTGTMDVNQLIPYLKEKLKRSVDVVPPKKPEGDGGEKKEKEGGGGGGGGDKKEKEGEGGGKKQEGGVVVVVSQNPLKLTVEMVKRARSLRLR